MDLNSIKVISAEDLSQEDVQAALKYLCDAFNSLKKELCTLRTDVDKLIENNRR